MPGRAFAGIGMSFAALNLLPDLRAGKTADLDAVVFLPHPHVASVVLSSTTRTRSPTAGRHAVRLRSSRPCSSDMPLTTTSGCSSSEPNPSSAPPAPRSGSRPSALLPASITAWPGTAVLTTVASTVSAQSFHSQAPISAVERSLKM